MVRSVKINNTLKIVFVLAIVFLIFGIVSIFEVVDEYEMMVYQHADHEVLLEWLKTATIQLTVGGGMIVAGFGTIILLFFHVMRKTAHIEREVQALREKNEAVEQLNQQTQKLAHHQRLQIIGTLTSSIAHEFNNLLTPIMGYSMMALEKIPAEDTELYDGIVEIYNTSRKAKEIISRLSDLSRKNTDTTFREAAIDTLIRKTLDVARPAKPKEVEIKLDLNCWEQRIRANEIQICQMLLNLILNSFHAMESKGGVLSISTSFDEDNVQIHVSDTGHGIAPEILSEIYAPFFSTKETGKGTGLGLAIVAQVVEDHHGDIRVNSVVNEGTTFTVTLPRVLVFEES